MTYNETISLHNYIADNDLLGRVEERTKANWYGSGSRGSYYSAIRKQKAKQELSLVEGLMIMEATALMKEHEKSSLEMEAA